jgi:hypothetical protein
LEQGQQRIVQGGRSGHREHVLWSGRLVCFTFHPPWLVLSGSQEWIDLGELSGFREEEWPFPTFRAFFDPDYPHLCFKVIYDKADLVGDVRIRCTPDELEGLPEDGIAGDRVVRNKLRIIAGLAPLASSLPPYKPPNKR